MEKNEIICISSDDEDQGEQNEDNNKESSVIQKISGNSPADVKPQMESVKDGKIETYRQKRKISDLDSNDSCSSEKKMKLHPAEKKSDVKTYTSDKSSNVSASTPQKKKVQDKVPSVSKSKEEHENEVILKPQLVVKERKSVPQVEQDVFPMFISLCLQKDHSEDMKTIVSKLKRRYEQMEPAFANSEDFRRFLNEKRNDIVTSKHKLYIYIAEVMNEMKNNCKGKSRPVSNGTSGKTASKLSKKSVDNNNAEASTTNNEKIGAKQKAIDLKIDIILNTMEKCERRIKKLEESEMNFDEDQNSNYIKLEKYKYRMVELYNKLCEYTGDNKDAERPYLRPKHLRSTGIVTVDQAITSFINSNISKRNQMKKIGAFTDALIFPDYSDILECVKRCNETHKLQLNTKKQNQIAKKAFTELGEYLQRVRHNDYWDTFSLYLEKGEDDPALKDTALAEKLHKNKKDGEQRLAKVFQEYVKKQDEMKFEISNEKSSEDETDEECSAENEDEENNVQVDEIDGDSETLSIEDDKISIDEDGKGVDKDETSTLKTNYNKPTDETNSEVIDLDDSKSNSSMSSDDSIHSTVADKNVKLTTVNNDVNISNNAKIPETEIAEESLEPSSTVTESKVVTSNETETATTVNTDATNTTEADEPIIQCEETTNDKPVEGDKPVLRVRSFAKPPTTWEDGRQKTTEPTASDDSQKVDPTKETVKPNSPSTKCGMVHIGNKVLPLVKGKYRTVVIPAGKNIINVKHITNNYVRMNTQGSEPSNVTKLPNGQLLRTVRQVVGLNGGSTVVHLPSNSAINQQTMGTASPMKTLQLKRNSTLIPIGQPKVVFVTAKQREKSLQSSTTSTSTFKSK